MVCHPRTLRTSAFVSSMIRWLQAKLGSVCAKGLGTSKPSHQGQVLLASYIAFEKKSISKGMKEGGFLLLV